MSDIEIGRVVLGAISTNCYFVYKKDGDEAVVFDPADDGMGLFNALKEKGLKVAGIFLTHGHFDHIYGVAKLRQLSHCSIYASEDEKELLGDENLNQSTAFGKVATVTPDYCLKDGETVSAAGLEFKMIKTPGHTSGSCCYYFDDAAVLISGDTLFEGSVGRTDFPTGSMGKLVSSIKEKLFVLPDETRVFPGHGNITTIGDEKKYNPFVQ